MWDGVIIQYGLDVGDLSGVRRWLFDSGWELQYGLILAEVEAAELLGSSYWVVDRIVVVLAMWLLVHQTRNAGERIFGFSGRHAVVSALVVGTFPVWHTLTSSILTMHLVCLSIGVWAAQQVNFDRRCISIVAVGAALFSFQLNSMLVFVPMLLLARDWQRSRCGESRRVSMETIAMGFAAIGFYVFQRTLNRPVGAYEGYNSLRELSFGGLWSTGLDITRYSSFVIVPSVAGLMLAALAFRSRRDVQPKMAHLFGGQPIGLAAVMLAASVAPYVAVGKSTSLMDYSDWQGRQAFTLAPAVGWYVASIFSVVAVQAHRRNRRKLMSVVLIGVICSQLLLLQLGLAVKVTRQAFVADLQAAVAPRLHSVPPGGVQIVVDELPPPLLRDYEANYLFAFGEHARRYVRITEDDLPNTAPPRSLLEDRELALGYAYSPTSSVCDTSVVVSTEGYRPSIFGAAGIGRSAAGHMTVAEIVTKC